MAGPEYFEKTPRKAARWFRAFIILALLYGFTFSLHSFFNWIFFFGAVYSLFMAYFTLPVQPKVFQARPNRPRGSQSTAGDRQSQMPQDEMAKRRKTVITIVSVALFVMFFIPFMISLVGGLSDENTTESTTEEVTVSDASALVNKGNDFFNQQQYDSAEKYYEAALVEDENYMEAIYGKGIVAYNRGNIDTANRYFLTAYDGGFRFAWLSWALADMYDKQGQTVRAIALYKESASLDSTYVDSYKRLAELEPANSQKYLELAEKHASN